MRSTRRRFLLTAAACLSFAAGAANVALAVFRLANASNRARGPVVSIVVVDLSGRLSPRPVPEQEKPEFTPRDALGICGGGGALLAARPKEMWGADLNG